MRPICDLKFPGYTILELLGETHHSSVYRARDAERDQSVIIKVIRIKNPSPSVIARLKHEYELAKSVAIDGIVKPVDLIYYDDTPALILEDFGGVSLKNILSRGFTMKRFLSLSIRIAEILGELHQANVSHRDIKPHNILINPETDVLKITDFGISTEITHAHGDMVNSHVFEGTIAYISPEQTGRMNCGVDSRTDLYSLGVTFYEMLTGRLPFPFKDPMEIIHAHIARMPEPPHKITPYVPRPVSDIVMKLLAKSASDRYQNSLGLAADLKECLRQLTEKGRIDPFTLGSKDVSLRFFTSRHLVGRDNHLEELHQAFERISSGQVEMVLVEGEPGIGKSSLVNEIYKPIMEKQGHFIAGKFNRFQREVPYSAIVVAFQSLTRQLLSESDDQLRKWKTRLLKALGKTGKVLTGIIPEIEQIIGPQPDVPELGPEENQNRINFVFKNFVRTFADKEHPLVLFLDDMQWADSASLNLVSAVITDPRLGHFLCVGTYRAAEADDRHPFMMTCFAIKSAGIPIKTLHLTPISPEDINSLITTFMCCEPGTAYELAKVIHDKTKGIPFFINQFLKTLNDKKHLRLDVNQGWLWDMDEIQDMEATENVVTFMAEKLHELPPVPLEIVSLCACIGNAFDMETLTLVSERTIDEIIATIDAFIQDGLLIQTGGIYRFYHERIHEAAYSLIPGEERERIHYKIGILELERSPEDKLINRIFSICDHLNQAGPHISGQESKLLLAGLNLKAGIKAKESAAYTSAVNYLETGIALLPDNIWQANYTLAYNLYSEQMECQYLCRRINESEKLFKIIIANAKTLPDQAKAYNTMLVLYTSMRSPEETVDFGLNALNKLFHIKISRNAGVAPVLFELLSAKRKLAQVGVDNLINLPVIVDEEMNACLQLIFTMGTPAFYINRNLFALLVLKGFNLALQYDGTWIFASGGCIAFATIIQTVFGDFDMAYHMGEVALDLNERFQDRKTAGMVNHIFAFFIQHWKKHARNNVDTYRKANRLSMEAGDFMYAGHSANAITDCRLMIGDPLDEILAENISYDDLMKIVKDPFIAARHRENNQFVYSLQGLTNTRESLSSQDYDEETYIERLYLEKNFFGLCYTLHYKVKRLYLFGMYEMALETNTELEKHIKIQMGTQMIADHTFYHSLILTGLMLKTKKRPLSYKRKVHSNQRKMKTWSALCPDNFKHKHDLVDAECLAVDGHFSQAAVLYHKAMDGARENGYLNDEALACERLALFYLSHDMNHEAMVSMNRAYRCYGKWGAKAKQDDLAQMYPDVYADQKTAPKSVGTQEASSTSYIVKSMDFSTVMKVSQVISREIVLDRLLEKTMHMSITNAGAERGCLIFENEGELIVQASEDIGKGEKTILKAVPISQCHISCEAIVNYVHHSGESLILGNAQNQGPFVNDPHIMNNHCKSVLCMPIMNKEAMTCILYMENNLTAEAFTADRLEILRVITAQAAISLQNAKLYEEISKEINVRQHAEEAMRTSEEKYRSILEEMQDVYCETDLIGNVTFINPAACVISGYRSGELIGSSFRRLLKLSDQKNLERYYTEIHRTGRPGKPLACNLISRQGKTIPLEIVTSLIRNKSGQITGFRNVGRDVSERKRLENDLVESSKNVQAARVATIMGLAKLAEYRDEETGNHLERIREYSRLLARELSKTPAYQTYITPDYVEDIYNSSILHDIGKVGVPDSILLKPGKLTKEEFEIIKTHTTLGGDALAAVESKTEGQTFLTLGKEIAYFHHEKWNGTGYPKGLKGEEIPLSARIVALADVYDALTSKRVYKEAFTHATALDIIAKDKGTHFAPDVVDAFLILAEDFRRIREDLFDEKARESQDLTEPAPKMEMDPASRQSRVSNPGHTDIC